MARQLSPGWVIAAFDLLFLRGWMGLTLRGESCINTVPSSEGELFCISSQHYCLFWLRVLRRNKLLCDGQPSLLAFSAADLLITETNGLIYPRIGCASFSCLLRLSGIIYPAGWKHV